MNGVRAMRLRRASQYVMRSALFCLIASQCGCGASTPRDLRSSAPIPTLPHLSEDQELTHSSRAPDTLPDPELLSCLTALIPQRVNDQSVERHEWGAHGRSSSPVAGAACAMRLSRPAEQLESMWLSEEWLLLDVRESVHLSLAVPSAGRAATLLTAHRSQWSLEVTLLRLPRVQEPEVESRGRASRHEKLAPPPLSSWSDAILESATLTSWSPGGVVENPLQLSSNSRLDDLPLPRVGQAVTVSLRKDTPQIKRGAWALHLPLWLDSHALRRSLTITSPRGAHLTQFGPPPSIDSASHARV